MARNHSRSLLVFECWWSTDMASTVALASDKEKRVRTETCSHQSFAWRVNSNKIQQAFFPWDSKDSCLHGLQPIKKKKTCFSREPAMATTTRTTTTTATKTTTTRTRTRTAAATTTTTTTNTTTTPVEAFVDVFEV